MNVKAIILAAGKGTRMKSGLLKVAHEVAGKSIVGYVVEAVTDIGVSDIYIVIGHQADTIKKRIKHPNAVFVSQDEQLGTGHAVQQVTQHFGGKPDSTVLILAGDCPLIKPDTLRRLIESHEESNASATILSTNMDEPAKYGRILRGRMGTVTGIKEAKDCSVKELKIKEVNTGVYAFRASDLFTHLNSLNTNNKQGEYYLTDIIHILKEKGEVVSAYLLDDPDQAVGINTRLDLAKTNGILYQENNKYFMEEGVTLLDPKSTFIDSTVKIGQDTIIAPFTCIKGTTTIGTGCEISPHCFIENGKIENNTVVPPFTCITDNK